MKTCCFAVYGDREFLLTSPTDAVSVRISYTIEVLHASGAPCHGLSKKSCIRSCTTASSKSIGTVDADQRRLHLMWLCQAFERHARSEDDTGIPHRSQMLLGPSVNLSTINRVIKRHDRVDVRWDATQFSKIKTVAQRVEGICSQCEH